VTYEFKPLEWQLAAYGTIIRGDESTSEDQVATACDPEVAKRMAACWNACSEISTEDLELGVVGSAMRNWP
jgi:hypothetical protein